MRHRSMTSEILDGTVADLRLLEGSFREVWGVNRFLGGMAVLKRHMAPLLRNHPRLSLVDVAGGTGDVGAALAGWAARRLGVHLHVTLVDNHPQVLAIARERMGLLPGGCAVYGDARALPFPDGQFDVGICNLALHHFREADAVVLLRELDRVCRLGWVVADLERHPLAYAAARFLSVAVWRNPITRHDGPLSVRRAFRMEEAEALVRQAGVRAEVGRHFPFRLAIASRPSR